MTKLHKRLAINSSNLTQFDRAVMMYACLNRCHS